MWVDQDIAGLDEAVADRLLQQRDVAEVDGEAEVGVPLRTRRATSTASRVGPSRDFFSIARSKVSREMVSR